MINKITYKRLKVIPTVSFFLIFVVSVVSPQVNKISLFIITPILFVYSFIQNRRLIFEFKPLLLFTLLFVWSLLTIVAATDLSRSFVELRRIFSIILLSYTIVYFSIKNRKYLELFYLLYIIRFFVLFYFGYTLGITSIDTSSERFSVEEINANMFGYYGYFAVVASFFLLKFSFKTFEFTNKKNIYFLFTLVVMLGALLSVFLAASRAGIIIILLSSLLYISYTYIFPFSRKTIFTLILFSIIIITTVPIILNEFYYGSFLEYRLIAKENIEEESRFKLLETAFNVGRDHLVFGVGPGNFSNYNIGKQVSHSSYFEIFANNGFLGLFIYLFILYNYFKTNKKILKIKKIKDKRIAYYFLVFLFTFLFYNIFYIFHTSLFLMSFFFLVSIHMELFAKSKLLKT